jgi:hypothetical protein
MVALLLVLLLPRGDTERVHVPVGNAAVLPWVAPELVRGTGPASTLHIAPGTSAIVLAVRVPSDIEPGQGGRVEVLSPEDESLIRVTVTAEELQRSRIMVIFSTPQPLQLGTYRVLFWKGDPSQPSGVPVETRFELRIAES